MTHYDVVILTDLRFPGGSSASTLEEIEIQHANGIKTGLYHKHSPVMRSRRPFHRGIVEAVLEKKCDLLNMSSGVTADILVVRHPSVLHSLADPLPDLQVGQVVLVVNHPPMNSQGRVDYLLPFVVQSLAAQYGTLPRVFPIGPLIRSAVASLYGGAVALQPTDWVNVFELDRFMGGARKPPKDRRLRIGRHSRPGPEKWPASVEDIKSAYLVDSENEVSILGGAEIPEQILGSRPKNWTVHEFGSLDVVHFLNSIDVFVYFHHPGWIESFGRVIAEAMATGLPTILPHHFEPLFKQGAIYQTPEGVRDTVDQLNDAGYYIDQSDRAIEYVKTHFSPAVHLSSLNQIASQRSGARVEDVA